MLLLPHEHRAPFIAPGRRNRKVHWNRPLSRAINSLGKFEKEDWRRALWLPESLRQFYPRWNNQFSPGGGSGCGCCDGSGDCTTSEECTEGVTDVEVEIPDIFTSAGSCPACVDVGGTYILSESSPNNFGYDQANFCALDISHLIILLVAGCDTGASNRCEYSLIVSIDYAAAGDDSDFNYELNNYGLPVSLPIELPFVSESHIGGGTCAKSGTDPVYITDLI